MIRPLLAAVALAALLAASAHAALPTRVGQCVVTRVHAVTPRLEDGVTHQPIAGSGSAVEFANGGYQVSYDTVPAVEASRRGDKARMCLVSIPHHCPPHDVRGRVYRTTNLRTGGSWVLPDAEHRCGGA
jgi:uncharacterized membrane protein